MIRLFHIILLVPLLLSCEHSDYEISKFTGDYRYYSGIAEFFDCNSRVKYYVAETGITDELRNLYQQLAVKEKEDIFIRIKGYLKEDTPMDGLLPATVFVPVKLIDYDSQRGCDQSIRKGY